MKIIDVEVVPVQAPGRTLVPVLVTTDEGMVGVGEAGLQRRWHAIAGVVEHLKAWLIGEDAMRTEYLWQRLFRGGFYPGDRLIGSAISAIDIALWDLKGQALGVPVYELLGGRCRDRVEAFTTPGYQAASLTADAGDLLKTVQVGADADATAELARACQEAGHRYFRLGLPVRTPPAGFDSRWSVRQLVAQLRAVRGKVGDALELMVDLHTRLSPEEAVWFCQQVEELGLFVVEDAIRSEHAAGYRQLRARTRVPLAAGEQWPHKWAFQQVIEEELVDYVRPDLCICGGLTEGRKIAAMAETHMVRLLPHNPLGPVCTAASLHLDLACDNAGPQEVIFPPREALPDVFTCNFELEGTWLTVPTGPGLGVRFDREAAQRHPAEMTEPPHYHRHDGSFTNY
ncbi:MAG: mandelate racemase/muconate lactonizing enzyme family protein [Phycisphaeraceae bacterium]